MGVKTDYLLIVDHLFQVRSEAASIGILKAGFPKILDESRTDGYGRIEHNCRTRNDRSEVV